MKDKNFTHVIHAAADSTNVENLIDSDRSDQIINGTKNILNLPIYPLLKISQAKYIAKCISNLV